MENDRQENCRVIILPGCIKAKAAPSADSKRRQPEPKSTHAAGNAAPEFKGSQDFRRRLRQRAAEADLKLNELLQEAPETWEEKRRLSCGLSS